jgi:hypothetical protein
LLSSCVFAESHFGILTRWSGCFLGSRRYDEGYVNILRCSLRAERLKTGAKTS